jgi:N-acetyl-beta-hexosaminidase
VNGKQCGANPQIQDFKRSHGLKSNKELQAYFTKRLEKIVSQLHKNMVGAGTKSSRPALPSLM